MNRTFRQKTYRLLLASTLALVMTMTAGCSRLDQLINLPAPGASAGTRLGDEAVARRVRAALLGNATLAELDIAVSAVNGDVRLSGFLDTQAQIEQAIKLTRGVGGAIAIHDELRLRRPEDLPSPKGTSVPARAIGES